MSERGSVDGWVTLVHLRSGGAKSEKPRRTGLPLRHPPAFWTIASISGLSLLWLQAFHADLIPEPLRTAGFMVLKDTSKFRQLVLVALGIHTLEACITAFLSIKRQYTLQEIIWYSLVTFVYGFPGMHAALEQHPAVHSTNMDSE